MTTWEKCKVVWAIMPVWAKIADVILTTLAFVGMGIVFMAW